MKPAWLTFLAGSNHLLPSYARTSRFRALIGSSNVGKWNEDSLGVAQTKFALARLLTRATSPQQPLNPINDGRLTDTEIHWILLAFLIFITSMVLGGALWLYKKAYSNALLAGAGISGVVYAATQGDSRTPKSLLVSSIVSYLIFHVGSYCSVTASSGLGNMGFMTTVIFTVTTFGILSMIPGTAAIWVELTGLSRGWSVIPVHLTIVSLLAWVVRFLGKGKSKKMRRRRRRNTRIGLLPMNSQDISNAESTSRTDDRAEPRRRPAHPAQHASDQENVNTESTVHTEEQAETRVGLTPSDIDGVP